jgi:hypothetical protein
MATKGCTRIDRHSGSQDLRPGGVSARQPHCERPTGFIDHVRNQRSTDPTGPCDNTTQIINNRGAESYRAGSQTTPYGAHLKGDWMTTCLHSDPCAAVAACVVPRVA